jgi:acyl dehydratase
MATGLVNETGLFERTTIAVLQMTARFVKAVKLGDTITTVASITGRRTTSKPDRGIVTMGVTVYNQDSASVLEGEWVIMVKRGPGHF